MGPKMNPKNAAPISLSPLTANLLSSKSDVYHSVRRFSAAANAIREHTTNSNFKDIILMIYTRNYKNDRQFIL